jgi:hypothetical protein
MGELARPQFMRWALGVLLVGPITQAQELPNLSAFVAIFLGFGRSLVGLAEGMFSIVDSFLNQVQSLSHTLFLHCFTAQPPYRGAAGSHAPLSSSSVLVLHRIELHGLQQDKSS